LNGRLDGKLESAAGIAMLDFRKRLVPYAGLVYPSLPEAAAIILTAGKGNVEAKSFGLRQARIDADRSVCNLDSKFGHGGFLL
jgi:hypothetical protein